MLLLTSHHELTVANQLRRENASGDWVLDWVLDWCQNHNFSVFSSFIPRRSKWSLKTVSADIQTWTSY
jgi:hypothetical protein